MYTVSFTRRLLPSFPLLAFKSLHPAPKTTASPIRAYLQLQFSAMSSSWSCKACTFLNPSSQKSCCQVCSNPKSSTPSLPEPKWICRACTFSNSSDSEHCEICGTRSLHQSLVGVKDLGDTRPDSDTDTSVGSVFLPLRRCKRKEMERIIGDGGDASESVGSPVVKALSRGSLARGCHKSEASSVSLKFLTYNVWFREDLELRNRMRVIGQLIMLHSPDVICFQEVTPEIYEIFSRSGWWKRYHCSLSKEGADPRAYFCMLLSKLPVKYFKSKPFGNSIMGRELCFTEIEIEGHESLVVATSHLESPCPAPPRWDQMYSKQRVAQAEKALEILEQNPNVVFGGDMNWDDKRDGPIPLPEKWVDAWKELRSGEDGFTYDTKLNPMLSGNRSLRLRLDRFLCCLRDYRISGIEMIGMEAIPELSYVKGKRTKNGMVELELPVLPSDHYGLLLTICSS